MTKLSEHRTALKNLGVTLDALEQIDDLIQCYESDCPGPAYLQIKNKMGEPEIQIDRKIFVVALKAQRQRLVEYLGILGIEVD